MYVLDTYIHTHTYIYCIYLFIYIGKCNGDLLPKENVKYLWLWLQVTPRHVAEVTYAFCVGLYNFRTVQHPTSTGEQVVLAHPVFRLRLQRLW
jgi:hypothetical protein